VSHLIAMSFDWAASPSITLRPVVTAVEHLEPCGWGFAWYPPQTDAAMVIKDPTSIGENAMTRVLRDWKRFRSTIFLCHVQAR
jgi:predicted glutamine amidotransferase